MVTKKKIVVGVLLLAAVLGAAWLYYHPRTGESQGGREGLLALLPADSTSVVFVDLKELRASAFLAQILAWAPQPAADAEYTKFVQATGFDYERDLDRMAISFGGRRRIRKPWRLRRGASIKKRWKRTARNSEI